MVWKERCFIPVCSNKIKIDKVDLFDKMQLQNVLNVCRESKSISDAGRKLYATSRLSKTSLNDSDRLKKYFSKFNLTWEKLT
jgi:transcriptional regulatory protein RtcR